MEKAYSRIMHLKLRRRWRFLHKIQQTQKTLLVTDYTISKLITKIKCYMPMTHFKKFEKSKWYFLKLQEQNKLKYKIQYENEY